MHSGRTQTVATATPADAPRRHAEPAILDVQAGLGETKAALLALGATAPQARSVAFEIDDHILLLAYDEHEKCTTIAVGGARAVETAHWLAHQFEDIGRAVGAVLPPLRRG
jgi:hypothetical protein